MKRLVETNPDTGVSIYHHYDSETDETVIEEYQDCQPILERNKEANKNADLNKLNKEDMWHMATIPNIIINKWLIEDGIEVFSKDPGMMKKVRQKLNSPEWAYLRTRPGRI